MVGQQAKHVEVILESPLTIYLLYGHKQIKKSMSMILRMYETKAMFEAIFDDDNDIM